MAPFTSTLNVALQFDKLHEKNYHKWKYNMQAALMHTGGWLVVNETIEEPSNRAGADWRDWATTNMIAAGLIYQSLEESVQPIVRN